MVSNAEMFTSDDSPNDAANSWDMSDAEKSEEEKRYESRERFLKDNLFSVVDTRSKHLSMITDDYCEILSHANHPLSNNFRSRFEDLAGGLRGSGQNTVEAFFAYIDRKFPSPYQENSSEIVDVEDEYRRSAMREGINNADNIDELKKLFLYDGSQKDLYIANSLGELADDSNKYSTELSRAIIDYAENPTKEARQRIMNIQSDHEGALSNNLFNIAGTFDESKTEIGKKLFDPTVILTTELISDSGDYYDAIMDYLRFKIENTDDEHHPDPENDRDFDSDELFSIQPDVILR